MGLYQNWVQIQRMSFFPYPCCPNQKLSRQVRELFVWNAFYFIFPQSLNIYHLHSDVTDFSPVRKKRVRFGAPLSPEFFDKTLPPSTPLQKGGTPMCPPSSTGKKRSLLKTPQRFEPPLPQPDFNSPQSNGASPVFVIDRRKTGLVYSDDVFDQVWLSPAFLNIWC